MIGVTTLGYAKAVLNCLWVSLLLLGLAGGATLLDRRLGRPPADAPAGDAGAPR